MDMRITASNAILRGLDTMLHKDNVSDDMESKFADILAGVVQNANTTDAVAHDSIEDMVVGDYDPDVVMLNSTKAELALDLVLQVRDKVVDSYNEIMRMQV